MNSPFKPTHHAAPLGGLSYRASSEDKTEGVGGRSHFRAHPWALRSSAYGLLMDSPDEGRSVVPAMEAL